MRALLFLLVAVATALAAPFLVYGLQPELLPGGGGVGQGWSDVWEMARLVREAWLTGREPEPSGVWDDTRLFRAVSVAGVAAAWLVGFLPAGLLGLVLLNARPATLAIVTAGVALVLYSCSRAHVTHDLAPDTVALVKRFFGLTCAAAATGFLAARAFRRTTV